KLVDYAGRFEFLEEACFALVRDHGVGHLSRQQVATKLGTSTSTVRRLLSPEADLRTLALSEVRVRRTAGRLRLNLAAPTHPQLPLDPAHEEEGPLHHRFAVANLGYVPGDVLRLRIPRPATSVDPDAGDLDRVVDARLDREAHVAREVAGALYAYLSPSHDEDLADASRLVHALIDGLGVAVCLGRLAPEEAVAILRSQLERLR
ncbi:MAG TPA: hypothetical protein VGD39_13185, partial [Nocardioides sp.]